MARGVRPALAVLAVSVGAIGVLSGCSSSSSSSTPAPAPSASATSGSIGSPSASSAPEPSETSLPTASGQLTGTQLENVLLPESDFPAGFATPTSGPVNSGGSLSSAKATYNLATMTCALFIQHLGAAGFGETAFVSGGVANSGQAYDEIIYQFAAPAQATAFVTGMNSLASRCGSFTAKANGQTGSFSLQAASGSDIVGHPTLELLETGTLGTQKVSLDSLFCADGVDVFGAADVGVNGADAPQVPGKADIIYQLMQRQAAASILG